MQVPQSLRFVFQFVICLAVCGLQGCGQAASPAAAPGGVVPASLSEPAAQEVSTSSAAATPVESKEPMKPIRQKQEVSVDETPREPATVADAARLLDLRTLPLLDGAEVSGLRTKVGSLNYDVKAELKEAFAFHHQQLKELGWQELPDSRLDGPNPRAVFTQAGFVVGMSAYEIGYDPEKKGFVSISLRNYGNVLSRSLPVPDGVDVLSVDDTQVTYTTAVAAKKTREQCDRLLLDLGWEPYGSAGDSRYFKKNAILVSARVATFDNQPGKTFLIYNTEQLSADIPMPTDYDDPRYDDMLKRVMFDCPTEDIEKVTTFYGTELAQRGWKPTSDPVQMDRKTIVIYRNESGDMVELEFQHFLKACRVSVKQSTALEVAELERQMKEEAKQRAAALAAAEAAPMPRVAIPIPGRAKKTLQNGDDSLDIIAAKGTAKAIVEAWQTHFTAAEWHEDFAQFGDIASILHLSKGKSTIEVSASDLSFGTEATIEVRGTGIILEPFESVAAFAELGGAATDAPTTQGDAEMPVGVPNLADVEELMEGLAGDTDMSVDVEKLMEGLAGEMADDISDPTDDEAGPISAGQIPLPKKAADLQMEPDLGMVIYRSELAIGDLAKFYRREMGKLGWTENKDETILFDDEDVGGITFEKGDGSLRIAVQSGQPESKTRIVIEGEGITWPVGDSDSAVEMVEESSPEERVERGEEDIALRVSEIKAGKCRGHLQLNDEKFEMNHVLAYQTTEFGMPTTVVYMSEKPFRTAGMEGTKVEDLAIFDLRASGHPPSMEIALRDSSVTINGFIETRSIGVSGREFKSEVVVKDGRVRGKVFTSEPYEFFGDTIQLSVELDVELTVLAEGPAPEMLAMDEDFVYPVPSGSDELSVARSPYRAEIRGSKQAILTTMTRFYRTQLADADWKEKPGATEVSEKTVSMSFDKEDEMLLVRLQGVGTATEFALEVRKVELAKKDGMVPKAGQAKIVLGNTTKADVVVAIDETEHKVGAGVGSDGPAEAKKIDVKPGKHMVVIKVPGEDPQTETIDVEPDTTWGVVAFGDEAYLTDRVY